MINLAWVKESLKDSQSLKDDPYFKLELYRTVLRAIAENCPNAVLMAREILKIERI